MSKRVIQTLLDPDDAEWVEEQAEAEGLSASAVVRRSVRRDRGAESES